MSLYWFYSGEFDFFGDMDQEFLCKLDMARQLAGVPFVITSDLRPDDEDSAHSTGKAVDIACANSVDRFYIILGCYMAGFRRIGLAPDHVHVDTDDSRPLSVLFLEE